MIKTIKITLISLLLAISLIEPLMAETILNGIIRTNNQNIPPIYFDFYYKNTNKNNFPMQHYKYQMYAYDLKLDKNISEKYWIKDLHNYAVGVIAYVDLIFSDKKNNIYRFKLTLEPLGLKYIGHDDPAMIMAGGHTFNGKIKLSGDSPAVFYIEVKLKYDEKGNPILINSEKNKYFQFDYVSKNHLIPTLRRNYNFSVVMISKK